MVQVTEQYAAHFYDVYIEEHTENQNMASRARKKMNKSPRSSRCGLAALQCTSPYAYIEGIVVYSSAARDYILAAVPSESGAAQEARYPAGTLGARRYSSCHL